VLSAEQFEARLGSQQYLQKHNSECENYVIPTSPQTRVMALWRAVQTVSNCQPQYALTSLHRKQVLNCVIQSRIHTVTDWNTDHDGTRAGWGSVPTGPTFCS